MRKRIRANLMLLTSAFVWGVSFVPLAVVTGKIEPMFFNGLRMVLAVAALGIVTIVMERKGLSRPWKSMSKAARRRLLMGGFLCGIMLTLGSGLQQVGMSKGTRAGKAGFIAALYIVIVPLFGVFAKQRLGVRTWMAVALSAVGLYFLCMTGDRFAIDPGDGLIMVSAIAYAGHIILVGNFSPTTDGVKLSLAQFAVTAVLSFIASLLWEQPQMASIPNVIVPILYAGFISAGVGHTMQILAQQDADPTVASLLMSLESVFAALAGWVLLGDVMSVRELFGCALMMVAIILAQLRQPEMDAFE